MGLPTGRVNARSGRVCMFVCANVLAPFLSKDHAFFGPVTSTLHIIADPRILSQWTESDWRTDSLHQSGPPLGLTWSF